MNFARVVTVRQEITLQANSHNAIANYDQTASFVFSWGVIGWSWLNKVMKSKVEWFMAPIGWLMTSCSIPSYSCVVNIRTGAVDQSINHIPSDNRDPLRDFFLRRLITFEMITVIVAAKCKGLHLPDSAHFTIFVHLCQRQRILCVLEHLFNTCHHFNLCLRYMRWQEQTLFCMFLRKKP